MKTFFAVLFMVTSLNVFADGQVMGDEALEMYAVLSHPQVNDCLRDAPKMVNVRIEKVVARCPGCNSYTITGHELGIDIARPEKTIITIKGKAVPGVFRGFVQTYSCSIKTK